MIFRMFNPWLTGLIAGFKPRKRMTLSEWAESNVTLPPARSASPGPYRIGDAEYQRKWLDACTDPECSSAVFVTSSQVGKTTVIQAAQGYFIEREPSPQISVWPTDITAGEYVEEVFSKFVEANDELASIMDGHTYPGGYIAFEGSMNGRGLASRPVRVLTGDELDRWAKSAGKEGSPVEVVRKRMTSFKNAKEILASTPLLVANSTIVELFKETRQHYYHLVCPHCGHSQVLRWERVDFKKGEEHKAVYLCEGDGCDAAWTEVVKRRLVREAPKMGGGWKVLDRGPYKCFHTDHIPARNKWGFWINEIYSPFSSMSKMAQTHSEIKGDVQKEKVFYNTGLALPWDGDRSSVADAESLQLRREDYRIDHVPARAVVLTAAVDVQNDRLVVMVTAWGLDDESWVLKYHTIQIDPSTPRAWAALAEELERRYQHPAGAVFPIEGVAIDSGGHYTQQVYRFSMQAQKRGLSWYAIKGVSGQSKPLWQLSEAVKRKGTKLWLVGVDTGKETVYTRYATQVPGPGYIHLNHSITDAVTKEMTAEFAETKFTEAGFPVKTWNKRPGDRNEGLDLMVYNLAVRASITADIERRLAALYGAPAASQPNMEQLGELYRNLNGNTAGGAVRA